MATDTEYALMAGRVYQSTRGTINWLPDLQSLGWAEFFPQQESSGFEAISFQKGNEIVISFAGTGSNVDWWANAGGVFGVTSGQLRQAADYYLQVKAVNPSAIISFTGHSLGGGLASLMAVFFGGTATTFDQAPFRNSANVAVAATLKDYLLNQRRYSEAAVQGLTNFINTAAVGVITGEGNVRDFSVQGEILSAASGLRIGATTSLTHGTPDLTLTVALHSQALLTAFLQSDQTVSTQPSLRQVTFKLPDVVRMIFDDKLYSYTTARANDKNENFIERLVRHQNGIVGNPITGETAVLADAMLTRFTADLWKLAQDGGMTLKDGNSNTTWISKALTAFAMQMYYEDTANATDKNKKLFSDVNGGIRFDMADVSTKFAAAFQNNEALTLTDAKGFDQYFKYYLDNNLDINDINFNLAETALIKSVLPYMRDWYVQAGSNGLAYTDIQNRGAFMLGGNGSDALVGGTASDLLVGNAGDDLLMGGKG
ncbi:MAG: Mbeg1-like protein, partial [Polaromonas sp.]